MYISPDEKKETEKNNVTGEKEVKRIYTRAPSPLHSSKLHWAEKIKVKQAHSVNPPLYTLKKTVEKLIQYVANLECTTHNAALLEKIKHAIIVVIREEIIQGKPSQDATVLLRQFAHISLKNTPLQKAISSAIKEIHIFKNVLLTVQNKTQKLRAKIGSIQKKMQHAAQYVHTLEQEKIIAQWIREAAQKRIDSTPQKMLTRLEKEKQKAEAKWIPMQTKLEKDAAKGKRPSKQAMQKIKEKKDALLGKIHHVSNTLKTIQQEAEKAKIELIEAKQREEKIEENIAAEKIALLGTYNLLERVQKEIQETEAELYGILPTEREIKIFPEQASMYSGPYAERREQAVLHYPSAICIPTHERGNE